VIGPLQRVKRLLQGGTAGNGQLTAIAASALLALVAVELATLLNLRSLLTVHAFVGMLLIPLVGLKLASIGWRMARYYLGADAYVRLGPPHVLLRMLVGPVLMLATMMLFGTGVALLVRGETEGTIVTLHQAAFVVWIGALGVHVLVHALKVVTLLRSRVPGGVVRVAVLGGALVAGIGLAVATLPQAQALRDHAPFRFDRDD
jgi:hypothetical protein